MSTREQDALKAYLNLLERKGVPEAKLIQRHYIVLRLIPFIETIPLQGSHYRVAMDQMFTKLDKAEWAICIPVLRDYFSFWIKDIKAIAAMNQDHAFDTNHSEWQPEKHSITELWQSLDDIRLTHTEYVPLEAYEKVLRSRGADDTFVSQHIKLAKLLLLLLRDVPHKQPHAYRQVIDANLPMFKTTEIHQTFLHVGREFYSYWKEGEYKAMAA